MTEKEPDIMETNNAGAQQTLIESWPSEIPAAAMVRLCEHKLAETTKDSCVTMAVLRAVHLLFRWLCAQSLSWPTRNYLEDGVDGAIRSLSHFLRNKNGGMYDPVMDIIPSDALLVVGEVMAGGCKKYGSKNWYKIPAVNNGEQAGHFDHAVAHALNYLACEGDQREELSHFAARSMMLLDQVIRDRKTVEITDGP